MCQQNLGFKAFGKGLVKVDEFASLVDVVRYTGKLFLTVDRIFYAGKEQPIVQPLRKVSREAYDITHSRVSVWARACARACV